MKEETKTGLSIFFGIMFVILFFSALIIGSGVFSYERLESKCSVVCDKVGLTYLQPKYSDCQCFDPVTKQIKVI